MARYHKIVWSEGMFLGPHHFQQWDRYHESILNFRVGSLMPLYWGLMDLEINQEGLENGNFMLLSCHGILPGGSCVNIPETDQAPASRAIDEYFPPSLETLDVYLATPVDRPGSVNCRLEDDGDTAFATAFASETRYSRDFVRVVDENTGDNEQEIPVAKKFLKILFTGESPDAYDCLKIAELRRTPRGTIALRDDYIPPCVTISASQRLARIVLRLLELLTASSNRLREHCRQTGGGLYEFGPAEASNLWLLQTINSFIPELDHFYSNGHGHPENMFRLLAQFAGALTAFSQRIRPIDLPKYDHKNLSTCFGELERIIRELLEQIVQELLQILVPTTKYKIIPLREIRESIRYYDIDEYLLDPVYKFYAAFKGEGDQTALITELPRQTKIASTDRIDFLIGKALRGIALSYLPTPPTDIPRKPGYCYFALDPKSDYWEDVQQTNSLAVFTPVSFVGLELELIALEES